MSQPPIPPIKNGRLKIGDAVRFIAETIYPGGTGREQYKHRDCVRATVSRAAGKFGAAHVYRNSEVDAVKFYRWARQRWPALQHVEGLPHPVVADASMHVESSWTPKVEAKTYDELLPLHIEAIRQLDWQTRRAEQLERDLAECRGKKKALTEKLSAAGKQGGRGNAE